MLKQLQVPPAFFLNLTSAPQALLAIWNGFDLEFLKPRLCSREILKNNVFWTLAGLPSPAGILYLGPKRFLRYMGVGAIRAIQSMTFKMIITRNMGGGAAIQRHDDGPSIMSELGGNCPTFQTVMWGPDMSTGDSFTPPPVDLSYNDCSLDATDRTDDMIIILYKAECMKFQQKKNMRKQEPDPVALFHVFSHKDYGLG